MNKKTMLWVLIGFLVIISIILINVSMKPTGAIKIGLTGHFSGEYANYGIPMKNAVELVVEETNNKGGIDGRQLELIIEDDESDVNKAASAINKLINIDNVDYIISAQASGSTSVIGPISQNNKRVLMITLASAPELAKTGEYVFRSIPSDIYQGVKMVEFINEDLGSEKVAGLYINNAYGVGIKGIINANENVEIVASEMFEPGASDFRTQLLKIKESNADTLVLVAYRDEAPIIFKEINELGLNIKILGSETIKDEEILKDSGSNAEGVYVTFYTDEPQDYVNFNQNYKTKFNEEVSSYSMYGYDGALALVKAIDKAGDDVNKVQSELYSIKFNGASGEVGFDSDGDRTGVAYILYRVENSQFVKQ